MPCAHVCFFSAGRDKTRLTKESGDRVDASAPGRIGGAFTPRPDPTYIAPRASVYDEIIAAQKERLAKKPRVPIKVTLPDGKVIDGVSWETTPMQVRRFSDDRAARRQHALTACRTATLLHSSREHAVLTLLAARAAPSSVLPADR